MSLQSELNDGLARLNQRLSKDGIADATKIAGSSRRVVCWIEWLKAQNHGCECGALLAGSRSAIRETIFYSSLGLGRAAIGSLRCQIDLVLAFTYFCSHPIEWNRVVSTGEGFLLRSEVYDFHRTHIPKFGAKLTQLEQSSGVSLENIYHVLSAHIHAQSPLTLPKASPLSDLVLDSTRMASIIDLQDKVDRALSNFLFATHWVKWPEIPTAIVTEARGLLTTKQQAEFFVEK